MDRVGTLASGKLAIHQRRYLGSKYKLLAFIREILWRVLSRKPSSFADLFAGTGIVGHGFNSSTVSITANDILYSNYCALDAFLGPEPLDLGHYFELVDELGGISAAVDDYVSRNFGGRYFGMNDAGRIGAVREAIERLRPTGRLRSALIASLLYSADRIANTCGHYDAYRLSEPADGRFQLLPLDLPRHETNAGNRIFNEDVMVLAGQVKAEVVYLDPPYNSRQYSDSYHLPENLARWCKPPVCGKAGKFDRRAFGLKSRFNGRKAALAMSELVAKLDCEYICVSYSNMEGKGHSRSVNRIGCDEMMDILTSRGPVQVFEIPYRAFSAGRSHIEGHAERLFICRVRR